MVLNDSMFPGNNYQRLPKNSEYAKIPGIGQDGSTKTIRDIMKSELNPQSKEPTTRSGIRVLPTPPTKSSIRDPVPQKPGSGIKPRYQLLNFRRFFLTACVQRRRLATTSEERELESRERHRRTRVGGEPIHTEYQFATSGVCGENHENSSAVTYSEGFRSNNSERTRYLKLFT